MKNKSSAITVPLFAAVIFLLIPISEKLLLLTLKDSADILLSASAIQLFIFAVPTAFYCKTRNVNFTHVCKFRLPRIADIPFTLYSTVTYFLCAIILLYVEFNVFDISGTANVFSFKTSQTDAWGVALAYIIIPAISEEMFFRSIILSEYSAYKPLSAITMSSVFFAMLHFSLEHFLLYFILGMILATMTYVTDSVFPAIAIHLLSNLLLVFFEDTVSMFFKESASSIILVFILTAAFLVSLILTLSSMEDVYEKRAVLYDEGRLAGSRRDAVKSMSRAGQVETRAEGYTLPKFSIFLSPTFLLCILIFILRQAMLI